GCCPFYGFDPTATHLCIISGKREIINLEIDTIVERLTIMNKNQKLENEVKLLKIPSLDEHHSLSTRLVTIQFQKVGARFKFCP
ncbi:29708_t:CDS:2, partial [Gigaspora margarita]